MKYLLLCSLFFIGCGKPFVPTTGVPKPPSAIDNTIYFPIASANLTVQSYGQLTLLRPGLGSKIVDLFLPKAIAQVGQGSATVNVTYSNPGVTTFTVNTSNLGNTITVTGNDLNLGSITLGSLDDNTLRVCTGVGAPSNKCNRLYLRIFTLGTATGGITNTAGFINTDAGYGIDVLAGSVITPIGFNSNPLASVVTNAATVYTYTIPGTLNRVRLSNITNNAIPIKADLANAGSGEYQMNLVVQYALGYQ